jgi:septal ring factor EnvC (AmiA/AmiB activator)
MTWFSRRPDSLVEDNTAAMQRVGATLDLLIAALKTLVQQGAERMANDQKFQADLAALDAAVKDNTAVLQSLKSLFAQDQATIASLNQQIRDLQAANPALDLTGLEADIATLSANNVSGLAIGQP